MRFGQGGHAVQPVTAIGIDQAVILVQVSDMEMSADDAMHIQTPRHRDQLAFMFAAAVEHGVYTAQQGFDRAAGLGGCSTAQHRQAVEQRQAQVQHHRVMACERTIRASTISPCSTR